MAATSSDRSRSEVLGIALVLGSLLAWLSAIRAFASGSWHSEQSISAQRDENLRTFQVATADDLTAQVPLALLPTFVIYRWAMVATQT